MMITMSTAPPPLPSWWARAWLMLFYYIVLLPAVRDDIPLNDLWTRRTIALQARSTFGALSFLVIPAYSTARTTCTPRGAAIRTSVRVSPSSLTSHSSTAPRITGSIASKYSFTPT